MRTEPIPSEARAAAGAPRRRVDHSGPGAGGGPDAPAPGGAACRARSVWPSGPMRTPEGPGPRRGRGLGPDRSSPERLPDDEDVIEVRLQPAEQYRGDPGRVGPAPPEGGSIRLARR